MVSPRATKEFTSAVYDGVAIASVDPLWKRLLEELNAKTAEKVMRPVTVEKGEILFSQGDMGDSLYLVQTGCIEISVYGQCGRRLIVNLMMPGAAFGEIALLDAGGAANAVQDVWFTRPNNSRSPISR